VACTVTATDFTNFSSILSGGVRYSVNGGAELMRSFSTRPGGGYVAIIPAQAAGAEVRRYVRTINAAAVYKVPARIYRDDFAQPQIDPIIGAPRRNW